MPRLSGIELAIQLKELDLDCNILLITGHPGYLDLLNQAEKLGHHFQVLQKPIPPGSSLQKYGIEAGTFHSGSCALQFSTRGQLGNQASR